VGLAEHLELLDYLLGSGVRLCGVGATDAHGGLLKRDPVPGSEDQLNFVSWIGDVDRFSPIPELVAAMRACDISFGDPFYVRGGMWITAEPDTAGGEQLVLDVSGVTPSAVFYVVEAEIDSSGVGHVPVYRQRHQEILPDRTVSVGGCRSGFARVEAWAGSRAIAFSNVVWLAANPAKCVAASPRR